MTLTNTKQISICPHCGVMTFILMDDDGNRYCGKCKEKKMSHRFTIHQTYNDIINGTTTLKMDGQVCQEAELLGGKDDGE